MRAVFSKVMWVGRATTFCIGLAVILAVMLGVGTTALAAVPGDPFKLGRLNTVDRLTTLAGSVGGPLLKIDNDGSGPALALETNAGTPPLKVSAEAGKATNLNADELDGKSAGAFLTADGKATDSAHADWADTATSADSAATAGDADTLDGLDSSDLLPSNQPSNPCPSGTLFHEGACIEKFKNAAGPAYPNAEGGCLQAGRRLPTVAELQTFRLREGTDFDSAEFTSHVWFDTNGSGQTQKVMLVSKTGNQSVASGLAPFRCVAAPTAPTPVESTWEAEAQSNLRNAAAAATNCAANNDGSYANCGSIAQLESNGYERDPDVTLMITTATVTRWVAEAQHNNGGSAYRFDSEIGRIEPIPRF